MKCSKLEIYYHKNASKGSYMGKNPKNGSITFEHTTAYDYAKLLFWTNFHHTNLNQFDLKRL